MLLKVIKYDPILIAIGSVFHRRGIYGLGLCNFFCIFGKL